MRLPIGSVLGQYLRASVSLTITTSGAPAFVLIGEAPAFEHGQCHCLKIPRTTNAIAAIERLPWRGSGRPSTRKLVTNCCHPAADDLRVLLSYARQCLDAPHQL